jgi:hypothetical protein
MSQQTGPRGKRARAKASLGLSSLSADFRLAMQHLRVIAINKLRLARVLETKDNIVNALIFLNPSQRSASRTAG